MSNKLLSIQNIIIAKMVEIIRPFRKLEYLILVSERILFVCIWILSVLIDISIIRNKHLFGVLVINDDKVIVKVRSKIEFNNIYVVCWRFRYLFIMIVIK